MKNNKIYNTIYDTIYDYLKSLNKDLSYHGKKLIDLNKHIYEEYKNKKYMVLYFEPYKDNDFKIYKEDKIIIEKDKRMEKYIHVNFGEKEKSYLIEDSLHCGVFAIYKRQVNDIFMNTSMIFEHNEEAEKKIYELEKKEILNNNIILKYKNK